MGIFLNKFIFKNLLGLIYPLFLLGTVIYFIFLWIKTKHFMKLRY